MQVRKYEEKDFDQIQGWFELRKMKVIHPRILPKTGFIVDGTAAVFLYKTDSDVCYLENLISNSEVDSETRDSAIKLLVDEAFKAASAMEFKFVMAVTDLPAVITRALSVGAYIETNKVLLTKQLS